MQKQSLENKNIFLKYWHIIIFVITTFSMSIITYNTIQSKVSCTEALAKSTYDIVNKHENKLVEHEVELKNIKESLIRIEKQSERTDNKIDQIITIVKKERI
jgi:phage shock protein A